MGNARLYRPRPGVCGNGLSYRYSRPTSKLGLDPCEGMETDVLIGGRGIDQAGGMALAVYAENH